MRLKLLRAVLFVQAICVHGFSSEEENVLHKIVITGSSLSIIGSIFILICLWLFKELRSNYGYRLIGWMAIADLFKSIAHLILDPPYHAICILQGFMKVYFGLVSCMWTCSIAFTLHMAFLKDNEKFKPNHIGELYNKYILMCWGVPIIFACLPLITKSYGDSGPWCWIRNDNITARILRFLCFYALVVIAVIYNTYVYIRVGQKLKPMTKRGTNEHTRLIYYPLVLLVVYFWGFTYRMYQLFHGRDILWLASLMVFFITLKGALNSFIYGLTTEVRLRVKGSCMDDNRTTESQTNLLDDLSEDDMKV